MWISSRLLETAEECVLNPQTVVINVQRWEKFLSYGFCHALGVALLRMKAISMKNFHCAVTIL